MKKNINRLLILMALICFAPVISMAQSKPADTTDLQFTSIPTAADSIAMRKEKAANGTTIAANKTATTVSIVKDEAQKTLWQIFLAGFASGLLAVLMPCIYPLLPLTVSFFTKLGKTRQKAFGLALLYGLSIIAIYVSLGLVLSAFYGPDTLNAIATNGIFNLLIFLMLVIFGISFLGAFEISLPSSLANKVDTMSDKGGLIGIFFMALTLVVVSFSCTGGVVASDLAAAFTNGEKLSPAISMLGFSSALALPFVIFSLFPSALQSLPKSGGWLNSIKVFLGFIEIAFALKFLSNVDLAYHWNWFDREVFLSLWIAIGILLVLYLLGKLKFSHDSDLKYLSVPRVFIAMIVLSFTMYMIPGLWGAPLKSISAFLPPPATQDFNLYNLQFSSVPETSTASQSNEKIPVKKYEEIFKRGKVLGLEGWYDYDQALKVSKITGKPILIDFTGWNCVNCRKMETNVWPSPEVMKRLKNNFIMLELYVDDKTTLDASEQYTSTYSLKKITTLGAKWSDYEASKFKVNSQPYYVIINSIGKVLVEPQGANYDVDNYIKFLDAGIAAYKKNDGSN
ncbi:thioredoxin family protein [Mucilaginibacter sp. HMF5004]|uniref:protein-disulfide reductase DsbD family protein n=1 Tax=Mucilaginibacter rivuli TaxID=2857527 RepID=UPI001C5DEB1E|nr:thioredoxin family protein [Mucilaginibacter rivuli]MBW4890349.1 thioredoxin family protein [Mucilaginibacter rivuli]